MSTYWLEVQARQRQSDRVREAEEARLSRLAPTRPVRLPARLSHAAGRLRLARG